MGLVHATYEPASNLHSDVPDSVDEKIKEADALLEGLAGLDVILVVGAVVSIV